MRPDEVAAHRYGPAVSPHLAAELAGERIDPAALIAAAPACSATAPTVLVEGVGGLFVPLDGAFTVCDLAVGARAAAADRGGPGLGTINHTLLTLAAARAAPGSPSGRCVLTPWPAEPDAIEESNRETIAHSAAVEVRTLARLPGPDRPALAAAGDTLPWRRLAVSASGRRSGDALLGPSYVCDRAGCEASAWRLGRSAGAQRPRASQP